MCHPDTFILRDHHIPSTSSSHVVFTANVAEPYSSHPSRTFSRLQYCTKTSLHFVAHTSSTFTLPVIVLVLSDDKVRIRPFLHAMCRTL